MNQKPIKIQKKKSSKKYVYLLLVFGFIVMQSCVSKKYRKEKNNTLHISFYYNPFSVDPRKASDPISSAFIFMLYEGLTRFEEDGSISLCLAENYEVRNQYTSYIFYLKDAFWSNGEKITAYDFEYSWKSILDPSFPSPNAYLLYPIKNAKKVKKGRLPLSALGIIAKDEKTLIVNLEKPTPYFLNLTSFCTLFPVPKTYAEENNMWPKVNLSELPCSGPFQLQTWAMGKEIVITKNPLFWNQNNVFLNKIQIDIIPDSYTNYQLYLTKKLDWIGGTTSPIPNQIYANEKKNHPFTIKPIGGTVFTVFNTQVYPFHNVNMRKAFHYATNRTDIIKNVTQMEEQFPDCLLPPSLHKHHKTFREDQNKDLAQKYFKKGLEELNIQQKEFPKVVFYHHNSDVQRNIALSLQSQWKEILGIHVNLKQFDFKTFIQQLHKKNYTFALMSWNAQYNDPMNILERFFSPTSKKNYAGWEHPKFIQLLEEILATPQFQKREEKIFQAEEMIHAEVPLSPLYHLNFVSLCRPNLNQVQISPIGVVDFRYAYFDSTSSDKTKKKSE